MKNIEKHKYVNKGKTKENKVKLRKNPGKHGKQGKTKGNIGKQMKKHIFLSRNRCGRKKKQEHI